MSLVEKSLKGIFAAVALAAIAGTTELGMSHLYHDTGPKIETLSDRMFKACAYTLGGALGYFFLAGGASRKNDKAPSP